MKMLAVLVAVLLAFGAGVAVAGHGGVHLVVNGQVIDAEVVIKDGRSYVPLRVIANALGANVQWDDPTRTITINNNPEPVVSIDPDTGEEVVTLPDVPVSTDELDVVVPRPREPVSQPSGGESEYPSGRNEDDTDQGPGTWDSNQDPGTWDSDLGRSDDDTDQGSGSFN